MCFVFNIDLGKQQTKYASAYDHFFYFYNFDVVLYGQAGQSCWWIEMLTTKHRLQYEYTLFFASIKYSKWKRISGHCLLLLKSKTKRYEFKCSNVFVFIFNLKLKNITFKIIQMYYFWCTVLNCGRYSLSLLAKLAGKTTYTM